MPTFTDTAAPRAVRPTAFAAVFAAIRTAVGLAAALFAAWVGLTAVGMATVGGLGSFGGDPLVARLGDHMALIALLPTAAIAALALLEG